MTIEQRSASNGIAFDERDENLARYLGLNPNSPADRAMVAVARHYDLDPLLKHVIVIPKGGVYLTRDGLLHIAHRSGQLDGIVVDQAPVLVDGEWVARVSIYRKDMRHPFTYPGRYPVNGGNKQYAQEMALKAAEAHALRRAFDINGIPVYDETRPVEARDDSDQQQRPSGADRMRDALASAPPAPEQPKAEGFEPEGITQPQIRKMGVLMKEAGLTDRDEALAYVAKVIGRQIGSRNELTKAEAIRVINALEQPPVGEPPTDDVVDAEIVDDDPDALWRQILNVAETRRGWTPAQVQADFKESMGLDSGEAAAAELQAYLRQVSTGEQVPA